MVLFSRLLKFSVIVEWNDASLWTPMGWDKGESRSNKVAQAFILHIKPTVEMHNKLPFPGILGEKIEIF